MAPADVTVAVCARAQAPALDRCLEALRAAGAEPLVFRAPPGQGLAAARNAALDAARADRVLALVDDDVLVAPGWLTALREAWAAAAADCACIGGPIDARIEGARPAWLTDAFLGVLGASPGADTFRAGNASFRVAALLGVGGFWPARGRPELRDWFTEEHHAQRELAAAGWSAHEDGALRASRLIDPGALNRGQVLALRARYGARSALVGQRRDRAAAARTAVVSAAGVAVALARRDAASAAERAGRSAENAGHLLPGALAQRDLQPLGDATPFRHAIPHPPPPRRRVARPRRATPLILVYHRVDADPGADADPETFAAQLAALVDRRTPVTVDAIAAGDAPPDAVAVTFDDAYAETVRIAGPLLADAGVPATVFVVTGRLADPAPYWWDELGPLLARRPDAPLRLTLGGETRAWARASGAHAHLPSWLQPATPEQIAGLLDELRAWAGVARAPAAGAVRPLTADELRAAASPLLAFGAHTRTHPNLRFVPPERRQAELAGSRDDLARCLGAPPAGLAYPFGIPGADLDDDTRRAARAAGFDYAVVNAPTGCGRGSDRFGLGRVAPPASAGRAFAALL